MNHILIVNVLILEPLSLTLNAFELLAELFGQIFKLFPVLDVLLEFVGEFLTFFLLKLFVSSQSRVLAPKLLELLLFFLIQSILLLILSFDLLVLLSESFLLSLGRYLFIIGSVKLGLELG